MKLPKIILIGVVAIFVLVGTCFSLDIWEAVESGSLAELKSVVEADKEAVNAKNVYSQTALFIAAKKGNTEAVRYLISVGSDINTRNKVKISALTIAVQADKPEVVKLLLDNKADWSIQDLQSLEGLTALHYASIAGNINMIKILLEKGVDIEVKDRGYAATPLEWACYSGQLEAVKLLIEKGANLNYVDHMKETALDLVRSAVPKTKTHKAIEDYIISKGAKVAADIQLNCK